MKKKTKKENYFSHIIKLFIRKRDVNVDIFQKHDLLGEKKNVDEILGIDYKSSCFTGN